MGGEMGRHGKEETEGEKGFLNMRVCTRTLLLRPQFIIPKEKFPFREHYVIKTYNHQKINK